MQHSPPSKETHSPGQSAEHLENYRRLLWMGVLAFLSMFILMYAMVDVIGNVYPNLNQFYMAGLMTAPMVAIELGLMRSMYRNRRLNTAILLGSVVAFLVLFILIRQQVAISDRQLLRSMIPHHAGALLMCERAPISDPEIQDLCVKIRSSQQAEIDQMRLKLAELAD